MRSSSSAREAREDASELAAEEEVPVDVVSALLGSLPLSEAIGTLPFRDESEAKEVTVPSERADREEEATKPGALEG